VAIVEGPIALTLILYCAHSEDAEVRLPFVTLTPSKMMEVVSEILDIDRYDTYAKRCGDEVKAAQEKIDIATVKFSKVLEQKKFVDAKIDELNAAIETFDIDKAWSNWTKPTPAGLIRTFTMVTGGIIILTYYFLSHNNNRNCILVDQNPEAIDIMNKRFKI